MLVSYLLTSLSWLLCVAWMKTICNTAFPVVAMSESRIWIHNQWVLRCANNVPRVQIFDRHVGPGTPPGTHIVGWYVRRRCWKLSQRLNDAPRDTKLLIYLQGSCIKALPRLHTLDLNKTFPYFLNITQTVFYV